ncbi:MAG: hypothetical protein CVV23_17005 [Ignavibacteriae bacterium HGW-Ignavibacteriae-2]|jgi:rhodanese-related sulfurtransferase|nr:rhodanese-like domain-containing protein [Bacteroidota bacterium]PKL87115.1 MAG: hypothetical protein CVV23_17005 [Ignavibacteriae bacterium HGW-Ignavibacteriae-2]
MNNNKLSTKDILQIILLTVIISIIYNYFSPDGIPLIRQFKEITYSENKPDESHPKENSLSQLEGIKYNDVIKMFNEKSAVFIDARDQWEFGDGHIPGAINIPEFSFNPNDKIVQSMDKHKRYILYCDGDDCDVSKRLYEYLEAIGFSNLFVYTGGYKEWIKNGNSYEAAE